MADRVLIEVVSQSEGLDETNAKLQELMQKEKELSSYMDSVKNQKQQWQGSAVAVAEFDKEIEKTNTELKATRKSIEELSKATKKLPGEAGADVVTQSFRAMRKEVENNIKQLQLAGKTGTEEYQKLVKEAGRLADIQHDVSREIKNMASDTGAFDTVLEGTQLIAGGFSVAQGAAALFGASSEDLQKVMVNLQSAIAITTGLQQIQTAIQKQSAIMQGIETFQTTLGNKARQMEVFVRAQNIAALRAQAAGESQGIAAKLTGIVVTKAATAAMATFNFVSSLNPYLLLITGIGLLVGAVAFFTSKTDESNKKQIEANNIAKINFEQTERVAQKYKEAGEEKEKAIQNEIDLLKARGASQDEIAKKEADLLAQRRKNANEQIGFHAQEIKDLDENKTKVDELKNKLDSLNQGHKVTMNINGKVTELKPTDESKKLLQSYLDKIEPKVKVAIDSKEAYDKAVHEQEVFAEEQKQKAIEKGKKEAIAVAEVKLIEARKGSEQELAARIAMIEAQKRVDLQNAELVPSERKKIALKAEKDIQDAKNEFNKKQLQDDVTLLDAQLAGEKDFNLEVYNLRLARLDAQKKVDLSDANLTANQRLLIEKKYSADVEKLTDDYLDYRSKTETNTKVSTIEAELASVKEGSQREHDLRVELLQAKAQEERDSALLSIKNEDERTAKIKEINEKLKHDIRKLDIDYIKTAEDRSKKEVLIVTQQYEQGKISKSEYENQLSDIGIKALQDEIKERIAIEGESSENVLRLRQELSEKSIAIAEQEKEARKQIFSELFSLLGDIGNAFFDSQKQQLDQQMSDLQHYYTTDAEEAKKNRDLHYITQDEMNRRQLEIKRKQAQVDKDQAMFTAGLQYAQGMISAAASGAQFGPAAFWAIPALMAIMTAAFAVQIASISSKPLPKYWKGRRGGKGEFAMFGEYGPELAWIPAGASLMPANETRLAMMGDNRAFDRWNMPPIEPKFTAPSINHKLVSQVLQKQSREERLLLNIDYDKLGRAVAKHAKYPKQKDVSINFDKSGLSVTEGNTTTHVLNTKYNR